MCPNGELRRHISLGRVRPIKRHTDGPAHARTRHPHRRVGCHRTHDHGSSDRWGTIRFAKDRPPAASRSLRVAQARCRCRLRRGNDHLPALPSVRGHASWAGRLHEPPSPFATAPPCWLGMPTSAALPRLSTFPSTTHHCTHDASIASIRRGEQHQPFANQHGAYRRCPTRRASRHRSVASPLTSWPPTSSRSQRAVARHSAGASGFANPDATRADRSSVDATVSNYWRRRTRT